MPFQIRSRYHDDVLQLATVGNVLFVLWRAEPTLSHLHTMLRVSEQHRDELHGEKEIFVNIVENGTPNFSDEIRKEAGRIAQKTAQWRLANAHIILLTGLRGITVRTMLSTTILLGKTQALTKVFDNPEAAARWLLPLLNQGRAITAEQFLDCYRELMSGKTKSS
jgi:hypothetical protein